jgi:hypothetical protein
MPQIPRILVAALLAVFPLVALTSCNTSFSITPPPEAVLAGAWKVVVTNNPDLDETLVFDESGQLIERRIKAGSVTVTQTDVHRLTRVTGNDVRIETVDNNVFEGTLNADKTIITGTLSTVLSFGSTIITTDNGAATLTKQ